MPGMAVGAESVGLHGSCALLWRMALVVRSCAICLGCPITARCRVIWRSIPKAGAPLHHVSGPPRQARHHTCLCKTQGACSIDTFETYQLCITVCTVSLLPYRCSFVVPVHLYVCDGHFRMTCFAQICPQGVLKHPASAGKPGWKGLLPRKAHHERIMCRECGMQNGNMQSSLMML